MEECDADNFDYNSMWQSEEEKQAEREIKKMPKGNPMKIKGKWLKRANHVTKNEIKYSYMRGIKAIKEKS